MLAEALQGAADLTTSGLLLIGLRKSRRRANRTHNFGYGREIFFWTLIAAIIMLTVTATLSIHFGWDRLLHPHPITNDTLALAVLLFGLTTNSYAFSLSYKRLHEYHEHEPLIKNFIYSDLIETKATFTLDLMGALSAFFGMISLVLYNITGNSRFDGIGALFIGLTTALLALFLVIEVKDLLIGRSASPETEAKLRSTALSVADVLKILDLRTMYIGSGRLLVNMELNVNQDLNTKTIEQLIDRVKAKIKQTVPHVQHIQVEIETLTG